MAALFLVTSLLHLMRIHTQIGSEWTRSRISASNGGYGVSSAAGDTRNWDTGNEKRWCFRSLLSAVYNNRVSDANVKRRLHTYTSRVIRSSRFTGCTFAASHLRDVYPLRLYHSVCADQKKVTNSRHLLRLQLRRPHDSANTIATQKSPRAE